MLLEHGLNLLGAVDQNYGIGLKCSPHTFRPLDNW